MGSSFNKVKGEMLLIMEFMEVRFELPQIFLNTYHYLTDGQPLRCLAQSKGNNISRNRKILKLKTADIYANRIESSYRDPSSDGNHFLA